jgi:hypothetical protein
MNFTTRRVGNFIGLLILGLLAAFAVYLCLLGTICLVGCSSNTGIPPVAKYVIIPVVVAAALLATTAVTVGVCKLIELAWRYAGKITKEGEKDEDG